MPVEYLNCTVSLIVKYKNLESSEGSWARGINFPMIC